MCCNDGIDIHWNQIDDVKMALDKAMMGKLCVQAWLGVSHVLFLGFGESIIPAPVSGEHHPLLEYELQIDSANWWVEDESGIIGTSEQDRQMADSTAGHLIGRKVVGWQFTDPIAALEISFEGGLMLKMSPYADGDVSDEDAWVLRMPIYYGYMKWDGTFGVGCRDHYFTDSSGC